MKNVEKLVSAMVKLDGQVLSVERDEPIRLKGKGGEHELTSKPVTSQEIDLLKGEWRQLAKDSDRAVVANIPVRMVFTEKGLRLEQEIAVDRKPFDIQALLREMVKRGASDLHLSSKCSPMLRIDGDMVTLEGWDMVVEEKLLAQMKTLAPESHYREFLDTSDTDFAYEIPGLARFRTNLFRDHRGACVVFRMIPSTIMSADVLGIPEEVVRLCSLSKGLLLVTGPTGSGKSTTLAALVDHVNRTMKKHIVTIEDPVEFIHENQMSLVNQREVHTHTGSFKKALRAALREDPDVILVGEMRDLETIAIAVEMAVTGHLVFGTLHTATAVGTVDRIVDQFPSDRQSQIRVMLADALIGVVSQVLCKKIGGGRAAAYEVLIGIPSVSNLIREGKTFQIPSLMQTGRGIGMRTMNDALTELVARGSVAPEEALLRSTNPDELKKALRTKGLL